MMDVFISYSRKDAEFIRQLFNALNSPDVWGSWRDIDTSAQSWEEICREIESADNFVLVLSPDSLNAAHCHRELEHARKNAKRILVVLYRPIDEAALVGGWYIDPDMRQY